MKILVTGGAGFIGSAFLRRLVTLRPADHFVNLDVLTYAGNLENLGEIEDSPNYEFVKGDIVEEALVDRCVKGADAIFNFAAESHVDRSIHGPGAFVRSNIQGTLVLLEAAKRHQVRRFVQISTDEVYGSLPPDGFFTESTPLAPNSPYSASKASADLLCRAYSHTYGMDIVVTRSSNNYGPFQHPEKFIPLFITQASEDRECPLYGDGMNIRDWLYVDDNAAGIWAAYEKGKAGEGYNLGGGNERPNLQVAKSILKHLKKPESLIRLVKDRPGHDRRYALDTTKARAELQWSPAVKFEEGLARTVEWYRSNPDWVLRFRSGEYVKYYDRQYGTALREASQLPGPKVDSTPLRRRKK